ncbi:TMhelix containing protein [Vibrio phage vB_VhaS_MAG7]|nr:TMhelix containing protein [Vibrio phage vB_VhaS_MAG7]
MQLITVAANGIESKRKDKTMKTKITFKKIAMQTVITFLLLVPVPFIFEDSAFFTGVYLAFFVIALGLAARLIFGQQSVLIQTVVVEADDK